MCTAEEKQKQEGTNFQSKISKTWKMVGVSLLSPLTEKEQHDIFARVGQESRSKNKIGFENVQEDRQRHASLRLTTALCSGLEQ